MTYREIIKKIKKLEIQGAQNIAIKGIEAFGIKLKETSNQKQLQKYLDEIIRSRPTEPALRNGLKYCFENRTDKNIIKKAVNHFKESKEMVAIIGVRKLLSFPQAVLKRGLKIFTHCHSSTVEKILIDGHKKGIKLEVFNTETRPKYQGRITAENLSKAGIPVTHMVDSCGREIIRKCDLFLFGCDAITSEGYLINKIGTEGLVDAANEAGIPAYSCTSSWKFDPLTIGGKSTEIEQRNRNEVWEKAPKKIKIYNPAFEITRPDKFTGIITELGIFKAEAIAMEFQKAYPYLLN